MPGPGFSFIDGEEERHLLDVFRSRNLTRYRFDSGPEASPTKTYQFEREIEVRFGVSHCLAVNSCTSALLAGMMGMGIEPGDEIIVPGYTFIASIAAVVYARAIPVLAEVDASMTLDPLDVEKKITKRTRAIMAVHMLGAPCDMEALARIAEKHDIAVIEDAAQACGASYRGRPLGAWGRFGAFSLNVFKTITAGDGGFLTTDDEALYNTAFSFHDHGFAPFRMAVTENEGIFGLNLRMSEFNGALALAQGRKIDRILETTREQKTRFAEAIGEVPGAVRRTVHDRSGEAATVLVYVFDSADAASRVASALGTKTLFESGRHYYGNMTPLLGQRLPYSRGCPFNCESVPTLRSYDKNSLPQTDDVLSRSVALSVGVEDSYLGTSFGIGIFSTREEIEQTSEFFLAKVRENV